MGIETTRTLLTATPVARTALSRQATPHDSSRCKKQSVCRKYRLGLAAMRLLAPLISSMPLGCVSEQDSRNRTSDAMGLGSHDIIANSLESQSRLAPVRGDLTAVAVEPSVVARAAATRPALAQSINLHIEDVRLAALGNNLDLEVELMNPAIAQQAVDREEAKFAAVFVSSARLTHQDAPDGHGLSQNYAAGVRIPLRTGGIVNVTVPFAKVDTLNTAYESGVEFSIAQPLLRNAGVEVNEYSIRLSNYQKKVVDVETRLEAIRILAAADRAYWSLYAARGELDVQQRQYELALRQLDQARKGVAATKLPRIEITRAESGVASRLQGIIIADTQVRRRERDLRRIMRRPDLPLDSPVALIAVTQPNPVGVDLQPHFLADRAVANRMEMLEMELQLAINASAIDFAKNQALPLFAVEYNYSLLRFGRTAGQSIGFTSGRNAPQWSLAFTAEIPIGNGAARAELHRAVLERVQRLATREQRALAIRQEVYDAVDQFNQDWQRILAARNEAVLAGRTYRSEHRQFELGVRTSTDVLYAAASLAAAQLNEIDAMVDYEISRVNIAFATGTLLGESHVRLPIDQVK
jgi:outer membrane protein